MAARLRNGRSRAWPFPTCGVGGTASHSEAADSIPSGANGGTDAAPFAAPVGRGEAEGALGVPDGGVTEARYWSAPSFVIWVTWPHIVQVVKYFVPSGMIGMKKRVK